jgi:hypothetical protein
MKKGPACWLCLHFEIRLFILLNLCNQLPDVTLPIALKTLRNITVPSLENTAIFSHIILADLFSVPSAQSLAFNFRVLLQETP